ncbi:MAG TPA: hypothetical protein VEL70_01720 [Candidatus Acidoferrum sp.]|nr:hypothetical protein [Candidatus Acidoferrum sp.]
MLAKLFFDESGQKESLKIAVVLFYYYNFDSSLTQIYLTNHYNGYTTSFHRYTKASVTLEVMNNTMSN